MTERTILVPGFLDGKNYLVPLVVALGFLGVEAEVISPQPSDGTVPIEDLAAQLAAAIEERFPEGQMLNLVGFSMGGLIARSYIQQLGGLARIRRLVTLATPHHGTYTAYCFNRPACLQMRPGSAWLAELNRDLSALTAIDFTSIWTPLDLTIIPANSSVMPVGKMISVISPLHAALPFDPRIVQTIAQTLREPEAAPVDAQPA